jgi:hypothetical protein
VAPSSISPHSRKNRFPALLFPSGFVRSTSRSHHAHGRSNVSQAFHAERKAWRYVILLNLARSVRLILKLVEDQFVLQDEYEAARSSITFTSGFVSPARSNSLRIPEGATTAAGSHLPASNPVPFAATEYNTLPCSDASSIPDSEQSQKHRLGRKHWASFVRSTKKGGNTDEEASKNEKTALKKRFTLDDLILGRNRARSHSVNVPDLTTRRNDKRTSSASSTCSTFSLKPIEESPSTSKTNSSISAPAPSHRIFSPPPSILRLPTGPLLTAHHRLLKMKLAPLAAVESQLLQELSTPAVDEVETRCLRLSDRKELIIRPLRSWGEKFGRHRIGTPKWLEEETKVRGPDDPSHIINAW